MQNLDTRVWNKSLGTLTYDSYNLSTTTGRNTLAAVDNDFNGRNRLRKGLAVTRTNYPYLNNAYSRFSYGYGTAYAYIANDGYYMVTLRTAPGVGSPYYYEMNLVLYIPASFVLCYPYFNRVGWYGGNSISSSYSSYTWCGIHWSMRIASQYAISSTTDYIFIPYFVKNNMTLYKDKLLGDYYSNQAGFAYAPFDLVMQVDGSPRPDTVPEPTFSRDNYIPFYPDTVADNSNVWQSGYNNANLIKPVGDGGGAPVRRCFSKLQSCKCWFIVQLLTNLAVLLYCCLSENRKLRFRTVGRGP